MLTFPRLRLMLNDVRFNGLGDIKLLDPDNPETKAELRGVGTPAYAPLEQFAGSEDHTAMLTCEDGNDKVVFTKRIEFTDFPLDET